MNRLRVALAVAAVPVAVAAEWAAYVPGRPGLAVADALVGLTFIGLGVAVGEGRSSRVGVLMAATGFAWFAGSVAEPALFLHRGPLVHMLVSYPRGRLGTRLERAVVAAAYVDAAVYPLAEQAPVTLVLFAAVAAAVVVGYRGAVGADRRARATALAVTAAVALVLAVGAIGRVMGAATDQSVLRAYQVVLVATAAVLFADLRWGRWQRAAITGLVLDLGEIEQAGTVRDKLARALGDPSLLLGYWVPAAGGYVDETGEPVAVPAAGAGRAVTVLEDGGERIGALVHDAAVLEDPALVVAAASLARLAVANARLQAEVRAGVLDVAASRRRIVAAADAERRRLERDLREGAERRLARVGDLLAGYGGPGGPDLRRQLDASRTELRAFARGVHPRALTESGLAGALGELVRASPVPVGLSVTDRRLPAPVEAAAYFVCSEALANVAKYAQASRATIRVTAAGGVLGIEIADDGVGGADPSRGSGLRGLADRVEALGGTVRVDSPQGGGTRVLTRLPLEEADAP